MRAGEPRRPQRGKLNVPVQSVRSAGANALPSSMEMPPVPLTAPTRIGSCEETRIRAKSVGPASSTAVVGTSGARGRPAAVKR